MSVPEPFASFIVRRLWAPGTDAGPHWRRSLIKGLRILYGVVRDISDGSISLHATGLVYTTLLSLVPVLALSFSVLKAFGAHAFLGPMLIRGLAPLGDKSAQEISDLVLQFVGNIQVGVLGALGLLFLLYTSVSVVRRIELAFSQMWHLRSGRSLPRSVTEFLTVLLIGPVILFTAAGATATLMSSAVFQQLTVTPYVSDAIALARSLLPDALAILGFSFIYILLPNTKVRIRSAVIGGIVAGVMWALAGWMFGRFVAGSASYTAIYSAFATIILFLLWLNVIWMIFLIGADIAFYHQKPEYILIGWYPLRPSYLERLRIALSAVRDIGNAVYRGVKPPSVASIAARLACADDAVAAVLDDLSEARLIVATGDRPPRFVPLAPFEATPILSVLIAIRRGGRMNEPIAGLTAPAIEPDAVVLAIETRVNEAVRLGLDGLTLRDLAVEGSIEEPAAASPLPAAAPAPPGDPTAPPTP